MSNSAKQTNDQALDRWRRNIVLLFSPLVESIIALKSNRLPTLLCILWGNVVAWLMVYRVDYYILDQNGLSFLWPTSMMFRIPYIVLMVGSGLLIYGLIRVGRQQKFLRHLTDVFLSAGLKNPLGRLPSLVFDEAVDEYTRKMRLTRQNLPKESFERAQSFLESGLHVYIDDIRENRIAGTIDLIYSSSPMPEAWDLESISELKDWSFAIGKTRGRLITSDLRHAPHLLVAGQTGGGKSTFLRQFIATLFVNNPETTFTLVDLKGGLEFQIFEKLGDRVTVVSDLSRAVMKLKSLETVLTRRMAIIKSRNFKDIDGLLAKEKTLLDQTDEVDGLGRSSARHVIVIDEAAEVFLTGPTGNSKQTQEARKVLSQIARQGRSVGIHLVVATQRPDSRSLDPQVKANLPGVLCFQMANDASSLTVLGNGRATDLPPVAGRAIWKLGADQMEIQTPHLSFENAEAILAPLQTAKIKSENRDGTLKEAKDNVVTVQTPTTPTEEQE